MQLPTLKKWFRRGLFALVCLVTLGALALAIDNYLGRRAWENYERAAKARGVSWDITTVIPPPIPDDQNFAMTPLLKPLFAENSNYRQDLQKRLQYPTPPRFAGWRRGEHSDLSAWNTYFAQPDLLQALKKFEPEMDEISSAVRRPGARFPLRYEEMMRMNTPHIQVFRMLSGLFAIRALAELAANQGDRALADTETLFLLANSVKDEPVLISQIVRNTNLQTGGQIIWEGLADRRWSEAQLLALQKVTGAIDVFGPTQRAFMGERAIENNTANELLANAGFVHFSASDDSPLTGLYQRLSHGWIYQNMIVVNRYWDEHFLPAVDFTARRFYPEKIKKSWHDSLAGMGYHFPPYTVLAEMLAPAFDKYLIAIAETQFEMDAATLACALERYYLAHGEYPEKLDALAPQFIAQLPHDVITGGPLHYERAPNGRFLLYSIGWNETDEHGQGRHGNPFLSALDKDDWVWQYPATK